jgi:hypothetical protein
MNVLIRSNLLLFALAVAMFACAGSNGPAETDSDAGGQGGTLDPPPECSGGNESPQTCAELEPPLCSTLEGCNTLSAFRLDEDGVCSEAAVGCGEPGCAADYVFAAEADGNVHWVFRNSCIPAGWVEVADPKQREELTACIEGN